MNWLKLFTHPGNVLPSVLREHRGQIRIESGDGVSTADTLHFGRDNAGTMEWVDLTAGGGGAVDSVNGQTGTVVLDQDDVGDGATYKQYNPASVSITGGTISGITDLAVADGGTGASDASGARTNLGLVIGTNVQAQDAELSAIAGLTSAADRLPYFTGSGTAALATFTSAGRALVDDANATAQRATLGAAPLAAKYIVQTANSELSAEQALGALATGILKNTTTTGVLSIAASGTDYAPATSGTSILKGNGSGGFSNAAAGTDYAPVPSSGAYASRPAAATNGRIYFSTDKPVISLDNGSAWSEWDTTTGAKLTLPNSGSFSWVNQGSASVTTTNGADVLTTPTGTNQIRGRSVAASNPMFVKARLAPKTQVGGNSIIGLFVSDGTKFVTFDSITTFGGNHMRTAKWSSSSAFSATYTNYSTLPYGITPKWIGIQDDGTNLLFWLSDNGVDWTRIESRARLDYLVTSITLVGWFMNNESGSNGSAVLYSWEKT